MAGMYPSATKLSFPRSCIILHFHITNAHSLTQEASTPILFLSTRAPAHNTFDMVRILFPCSHFVEREHRGRVRFLPVSRVARTATEGRSREVHRLPSDGAMGAAVLVFGKGDHIRHGEEGDSQPLRAGLPAHSLWALYRQEAVDRVRMRRFESARVQLQHGREGGRFELGVRHR